MADQALAIDARDAMAHFNRAVALAAQPQAQQMTTTLRLRIVGIDDPRMQGRIVGQPLNIAGTEVHLDGHAGFIGDVIEQF